jgi:hypothetical protein
MSFIDVESSISDPTFVASVRGAGPHVPTARALRAAALLATRPALATRIADAIAGGYATGRGAALSTAESSVTSDW